MKYGVSYTFYKYGFRCLRRLAFLNSWISILVSIEQLAARNVVMPCRQSFASSNCVAPSVVIHIQMKYGASYTFYKYGFRCLRRLAFLNSWISICFHRTSYLCSVQWRSLLSLLLGFVWNSVEKRWYTLKTTDNCVFMLHIAETMTLKTIVSSKSWSPLYV